MLCANCGTENEDNMLNCQFCGAPLQNTEEAPQEQGPVAMPKSLKLDEWVKYVKSLPQKIVLAGLAGVLALLLIVLIFVGGNYKSAVDSYYRAMQKADAKKMINLTVPRDIQDEWFEEIEDNLDMDKDEYIEYIEELYEERMEEISKFEWEIKEAEKLNNLDKLEEEIEDMYDVSDLDDFKELMDERYEDYSKFDADRITEAYAVKIRVKYKEDGDRESRTIYDIVYQYKGSWYLLRGF